MLESEGRTDPTVQELLQVQRRLLQAERRAAIAQATASVTHDISQPLTAMLSNGELALWEMESLPSSPSLASLRSRLEKMLRATDAMTDILKRTQRTVQAPEEPAVLLDLGEILRGVIPFLCPRAESSGIVLDIDPGSLPQVSADPLQMTQVFLHLLSNAFEALENRPGGRVRVCGAVDPRTGERLVRVEDDGPGVDPEIRDRIFRPFFTTRPTPQHLGLGLSIARQILKRLGASIELLAHEGSGAVFELRFPSGLLR